MADYAMVAGHVISHGKPFTGGDAVLRHTAKDAVVACRQCGVIPAAEVGGWTSDWLALCQGARRHALEEGHEVAVLSWNGALYGPRS